MKGHWTYFALMGAILSVACLVRYADPVLMAQPRAIAFDTLQRLHPRTFDPATPVRIVDIDEASLAARGQWPWPRTDIAELVTKLEAAGAVAIAFDMVFPEADRMSPAEIARRLPDAPEFTEARATLATLPSNDEILADAIARSSVILGFVGSPAAPAGPAPPLVAEIEVRGHDPKGFVLGFPSAVVNLPVLSARAPGSGFINWVAEHDQIIRRLPILLRVGDRLYPSIAAEALRLAQGYSNYLVVASGAENEQSFGRQTGIARIHIGNAVVPTDAEGQIWLRFGRSDARRYLSAHKVLDGTIGADDVKGRIVLIGTSAAGLLDLRATPLEPAMPGVEAHAQAIENMLGGDFLLRPDFATGLEVLFAITVSIALAFAVLKAGAVLGFVLGGAAVAFVLVASWTAYAKLGWLLDPVFPSVTLSAVFVLGTVAQYIRTESDRNRVRHAFGHYMAPALVEQLAADPSRLVLGGEERDITILFADVRGFTRLSEGMNAQVLTQFVIELFSPLSQTIMNTGGTIDKYIGDSVMAFWNAPLDQPDHGARACRAALGMLADLKALNERLRAVAERDGRPFRPVSLGIGINSGNCCVGNFGSAQRFDYSALGDDVNLASRLEGLTKMYGLPIVIGERTARAVPDLAVMEVDLMRVRGYQRAVRVFTVLGDEAHRRSDGFERLARTVAAMLVAYRSRRFDDAKVLLQGLATEAPELKTLWSLYEKRLASYAITPPPETWDGSEDDKG